MQEVYAVVVRNCKLIVAAMPRFSSCWGPGTPRLACGHYPYQKTTATLALLVIMLLMGNSGLDL